MSILQGGPAFPVLSLPLYEYLCTREFHKGLTTLNEDVPNGEVYRLLKQVLTVFVYAYALCMHMHCVRYSLRPSLQSHLTCSCTGLKQKSQFLLEFTHVV